MVDSNKQTLDKAINALSMAVEGIESRLTAINSELELLTKKRKQKLQAAVAALLPAISNKVLKTLKQQLPQFVTSEVEQAFAENGKFLGLFATRQYDNVLSLLQTKLASFLDQSKYGEIAEIDRAIKDYTTEKSLAAERSKETLALLTVMQRAAVKSVPLTAELQAQVVRIAAGKPKPKQKPQSQPVERSSATSHTSSTQYYQTIDSSDDMAYWLYLITDVPTNMKTLMLDAILDSERDEDTRRNLQIEVDSYSRNTSDYRRDDSSSDRYSDSNDTGNSSSNIDTSVSSAAAMGAAAAVGAAAVVGAAVIATDDSLGFFS